MSSNTRTTVERRATYVTLTGIFLSLFAAFSLRERQKGAWDNVRPFDLVLLGLATFRLGRMVAYDKVIETFRLPFTETTPDPSGMGKTVSPRNGESGVVRALGELLSCPICAGTWIAAALTYALSLAPRPTRAFLTIMSAVGMAELLNSATEALSWTGRAAREESSTLHIEREE